MLTLFATTGVILAAVYMLHAVLKMFWGPLDNPENEGLADLSRREGIGLAEISLGDGLLRGALWGKNLTDEEYGVHGQDLGLENGYGISGVVFGQPRSFGVDLIWEFYQ